MHGKRSMASDMKKETIHVTERGGGSRMHAYQLSRFDQETPEFQPILSIVRAWP